MTSFDQAPGTTSLAEIIKQGAFLVDVRTPDPIRTRKVAQALVTASRTVT